MMRDVECTEKPIQVTVTTSRGESFTTTARWVSVFTPGEHEPSSAERQIRYAGFIEFDDVPPGTLLDRLARETAVADCWFTMEGRLASLSCIFWHTGAEQVRAIYMDHRAW